MLKTLLNRTLELKRSFCTLFYDKGNEFVRAFFYQGSSVKDRLLNLLKALGCKSRCMANRIEFFNKFFEQ
ncbi:hypothetical protein ABW11_01465 [Pluralibacter gergoviae]|nr:hypothetical protein LG71_08050 [Pluralibacter gergoviae]KMK05743.1 hypothetical protein ABW07_19525 [Pluralibacter gergoviae]KMK19170.1 hypothetical protein ABW09_07255 [Pluralibacter gergoviae]KMK25961.1 hypothetical protein ABW10_04435 [Pluralibacter gergoviae]KMK30236.1 hypothetical protein ABW11_01465 [Pluralibacter gergoviae]